MTILKVLFEEPPKKQKIFTINSNNILYLAIFILLFKLKTFIYYFHKAFPRLIHKIITNRKSILKKIIFNYNSFIKVLIFIWELGDLYEFNFCNISK